MPLVSSQPPAARPKLSVVMITYRHEAYIAKAIESVLIQNVDFPVELVIGEDCSPDGTRAIVRHYADKYPAVIRPLLPQNNVGMMNNFIATLEATRGEYVALLEGDDYWTDPEKLSKQVTYLEENPPCALCHHRVFYLKDEMLTKEFPKTHLRKERIPGSELAYGNFIQTCAVVFRRSHVPKAIRDFASS